MSPTLLLLEVSAVVIANYLLAWLIALALHGTLAWCTAAAIDRPGRLAERDRVTLWLGVVLVPPVTAFVQVAFTGAALPWSPELTVLGGFIPGAIALVVAAFGAVTLVLAATWFVRLRALRQLGPRAPARFPAMRVWQSLPGRAGLRPRLTRSDRVVAPLVVGGEEIVLPTRTFGTLTLAEQRALLAHEQAHLVHRDALWLGFAGLASRLLWMHPLAGRAWRRAADAAEFAADEHAVAAVGSGRPLATALVGLAAQLPGLAPGLSAAGGRLEERVLRLVTERRPRRPTPPIRRLAFAAGMVLVLLALPAPRVDAEQVANTIPWLTPSKDPPNARMLALREFLRRRP